MWPTFNFPFCIKETHPAGVKTFHLPLTSSPSMLWWFCFSSSPPGPPGSSWCCSSESNLSSSCASLLWSSKSSPKPPESPGWPVNVSPDRKLVSVTSGEHGGDSEEREERGDKELIERGVSDSLRAWILVGSNPTPPPAPPPASPPIPPVLTSGLPVFLAPLPVTTSCSWMVVMELEGR